MFLYLTSIEYIHPSLKFLWPSGAYRTDIIILFIIIGIIALLLVQSNVFLSNPAYEHLETNSSQAQFLSLDNPTAGPQMKRLPKAIIIGSRKCGTRALLKFLELNPSVKAAQNEVHFFDKQENYRLGLSWYASQMPDSSEDELTIEKSPAYFVTDQVPQKIVAMNSSIKLVLILRNPVTRLISDYSQLVANKIEATMANELNSESKLDINEAWEEAGRIFERQVLRQDGGVNDKWRAVKFGLYSNYLERWMNHFSLQQFHFVDGELMIRRPHEVLRKLENFLDLKPTIEERDFVFNPQKGYFCISLRNQTDIDITDGINISDLTKQDHPRGQINCLSKHKGRRHITVRESILEKLGEFYAPYNQYLFSMIGQKFDWN